MGLTRREAVLMLGSSAALPLLAGCGGGGSGGGSGGGPQPSNVVKSTVVLLPSDGSVTVVSATATQIVLTGKVPTLMPGSVIVSGIGNGFLAKVTSVTTLGSTITAQVTQATLEDVFSAATLNFQKDLAFSDLAPATSLLPGVTITAPTSARGLEGVHRQSRSTSLGTFQANFGQAQVSADITVNGSATVDFGLTNSFVLDGQGIKSASFIPSVAVSGSLVVTGTITVEASNKVRYAHIPGLPLTFYVEAGPFIIPVKFVPVFDLYFLYDAKAVGEASFTASGTATISAGIEYERGTGWSFVTPPPTTSFNFEPSANFQAGLTVTPVQIELSELMYGIIGPTAVVDLPTLDAEFTIDPPSHSVPGDEISCSATLDATAGYTIQILGKTLQDPTLPGNLSKTFSIFDEFFPDSNITIRSAPRRK